MDSRDIHIPGYTIHAVIGHGGMASVYLATQESLNRKVAVKVLRNTGEPDIAERFINEARYIAGLHSPHIVTIHDIAKLASGDCYIAMEYLGGGGLAEGPVRPRGIAAILTLVRQVAEGLAVVHAGDIIHRDVKPSNILFREDGTAVLTDFGIAKSVAADPDLTQAGLSLGSPSYSSPEQAQCLPIDATTDIYSLGVVLLELLLGYNPFRGDSHTSTALNHIQLPAPPLPAGVGHLSPLVNRMLAKQPGDRYQSCAELVSDIDGLLARTDAPPAKRRRGSPRLRLPGFARWPRADLVPGPRRVKGAVAALATAAMVAGIYFGFFYQDETEREIERLLGRAELSMQAGRYLAPQGNSAQDFYRQVLLLDGRNMQAILGLKSARKKQLETYLARGAQALENGRLQKPEGDSALYYFRQALALEADNARARAGIAGIIGEYIRLARAGIDNSDYEGAHRHVDLGLGIAPDNEALLSLSTQIERRQAQAERLARAQEPPRRQPPRQAKPEQPSVRKTIRNVLDRVRNVLTGDR